MHFTWIMYNLRFLWYHVFYLWSSGCMTPCLVSGYQNFRGTCCLVSSTVRMEVGYFSETLYALITWHWKVRVSFLQYIYIQSNKIHNVVALIKCLLVLRFQLCMFRTITVHPQELLCRYCKCRLWYVVRNALPGTSSWYSVLGRTSYNVVPAGHIGYCVSYHIP